MEFVAAMAVSWRKGHGRRSHFRDQSAEGGLKHSWAGQQGIAYGRAPPADPRPTETACFKL